MQPRHLLGGGLTYGKGLGLRKRQGFDAPIDDLLALSFSDLRLVTAESGSRLSRRLCPRRRRRTPVREVTMLSRGRPGREGGEVIEVESVTSGFLDMFLNRVAFWFQ